MKDVNLIDLRNLPGSESGFVVKGEGKFPRFAKYEDGTLFVATHRGTHQLGKDNSLQGFLSADGGRTWSEPRTMFRQHGIDPRSPAVGVGPDGVLYAGWRERRWDDATNSRVAFYKSDDQGLSWQFVSEVTMPDDRRLGQTYGKLRFTTERETLLCVYTADKERKGPMDSRLFVSEDQGRTWTQRSIIRRGANETSLVSCPDGSLLAIYRNNEPGVPGMAESLWATRSDDGARTWQEPVPVTEAREHPAEAVFLDDDVLLCCYSHRHEPFGVRAKISLDAGRMWRDDVELLVDDTWSRADCGYPTVEIVRNDTLLIAWYVNEDHPVRLDRERQCRTLHVPLGTLRSIAL